jgi:hypothetical protein
MLKTSRIFVFATLFDAFSEFGVVSVFSDVKPALPFDVLSFDIVPIMPFDVLSFETVPIDSVSLELFSLLSTETVSPLFDVLPFDTASLLKYLHHCLKQFRHCLMHCQRK